MTIASHYIFFDPGPETSVVGFIDFDAAVFGVIASTSLLFDSDFLANTGVTYMNPEFRGMEPGDFMMIDPTNPNRVHIEWTASSPGDYLRVLTMRSPLATDIPEPGTLAVLGSLLIGLGSVRRVRRGAD